MCTAAACLIVAALTMPGTSQEAAILTVKRYIDPDPATSSVVAAWRDRIPEHNAFMTKIGGPGAPKAGANAPIYISSAQMASGSVSITVSMWLATTSCDGVGNGPSLGDVQPQMCQARVVVNDGGQSRVFKTEFCNLLYEYDDLEFNKHNNHVTFKFDAATRTIFTSTIVDGKQVSDCTKSLKL